MSFLDDSPSPWHAAASAADLLVTTGFAEIAETDSWVDAPPAGFVRRGAAVVAWRRSIGAPSDLRVVGAHTDSPGLRVHPVPDRSMANWNLLGVETYGGLLLNSWLDRDLGVAGQVVAADGTTRLVRVDRPVARIPQLAIHLDRDVNERGLKLDKHTHLRPVWSVDASAPFASWLSEQAGIDAVAWDLGLYDTQPAARLGADEALLASGRLDNQISCWAAICALVRAQPTDHLAVAVLFDHEEVGSASTTGASGPLLATVSARLLAADGLTTVDDVQRVLARSSCISADNAHALHPNYADRHDAAHAPLVNHGPAVKLNANQRYATDAVGAATFVGRCQDVGIPVQTFVSRNDMPCGSTIGPLTATEMGIATIDVGVPQLSMHSARELCGVDDPGHLAAALAAYWRD